MVLLPFAVVLLLVLLTARPLRAPREPRLTSRLEERFYLLAPGDTLTLELNLLRARHLELRWW